MSSIKSSAFAPFLVLGFCTTMSAVSRAGTFPIEPGEAVVTCGTVPIVPRPTEFVLGIVDVRHPECDPNAQLAQHWPAPMYHNEMPNPTMNRADEWTYANLGDVFGIALDDLDPPNIYLTSTSIYLSQPPGGDGTIRRIDGVSGAITVFQTLPNSGQGLGNIAFDSLHRQFFVTNHEDGNIYRLSLTGVVLDRFDPFAPDDGLPGYCPLGERLWGVGVFASRVYFGVWVEDENRPQPPSDNAVYSVALDASGGFVPADTTLELLLADVTVPPSPLFSSPVSDIAFAPDGRMMLAERSMRDDATSSAHNARLLEYRGGHLAWTATGSSFGVGVAPETNAAGGVDYGCFVPGSCPSVPRVWGTGDALVWGPDFIYGLQGIPESGGSVSSSYVIDLDGDFQVTSKTTLGDIEIRRSCPTVACPDGPVAVIAPTVSACVGNTLVLDGSPSSPCTGSGLEFRWLDGATIVCDWSPIPTCAVTPMGPTAYTLEVHCLDPTRDCRDSALITVDPLPTPIPDLQLEVAICRGEAVTLDARGSRTPGCTTVTEFQFRQGATILQPYGPASTHGPLIPSGTTTYSVDVRCGGCEATTSRDVVVTPPPMPQTVAPAPACVGATFRLDATPSSGCGPAGIEYQWRDGATIVCPWSPTPTCDVMPALPTAYDLDLRCLDNPRCVGSDRVSVDLVARPIAVAGPRATVCEGGALLLDASASNTSMCTSGALFEWWQGPTLVRAASPDPTYTPATTPAGSRTYTVRLNCVGLPDCDASDDVVVEVRTCSLSVTFDSVTAQRNADGAIEIAWTTATEIDTVLFIVERSTAATPAFTRIGNIVSAHGSGLPYALIDPGGPSRGLRYYRVVEYTPSGRGDVSAEVSLAPERVQGSGGRTRRR